MASKKKSLTLAAGAVITSVGVLSATQLFATEDLGTGADIRTDLLQKNNADTYLGFTDNGTVELKCGEGKCGEGKCGEKGEKKEAKKEKASKTSESKCGEGKCGEKGEKKEAKKEKASKTSESKCGEGKCGM